MRRLDTHITSDWREEDFLAVRSCTDWHRPSLSVLSSGHRTLLINVLIHAEIGVLSWPNSYWNIAQRTYKICLSMTTEIGPRFKHTIRSHAVVLRLVILGTFVRTNLEVFLAEMVLAVVALEW
jgi:hypothetical protein